MENKVGTKIREARKMKGYSQEELAESSSISLRTIQRVENNQSDPRGKTLQLLCEALEINVEDILDFGKSYNGNYIALFHLSILAFIAFPTGNIIVPLLLWIYKRDKIIGLNKIATKVFIIQIVFSILLYGNLNYHTSNWNPDMIVFGSVGLIIGNIIIAVVFAIRDRKRFKGSSES